MAFQDRVAVLSHTPSVGRHETHFLRAMIPPFFSRPADLNLGKFVFPCSVCAGYTVCRKASVQFCRTLVIILEIITLNTSEKTRNRIIDLVSLRSVRYCICCHCNNTAQHITVLLKVIGTARLSPSRRDRSSVVTSVRTQLSLPLSQKILSFPYSSRPLSTFSVRSLYYQVVAR